MRIYGQWAGNEAGHKEKPERCIVEVWGNDWLSRQCHRERGHGPDGLYCKQHGKMAHKGRNLSIPKDEAKP